MRRARVLFLGLLLLAIAACSSLLFDQGNAFPCDYTAPENERDKACAPTEVQEAAPRSSSTTRPRARASTAAPR